MGSRLFHVDYAQARREVDRRFREHMADGIEGLRLPVDASKVKGVSSAPTASGSDAPTLTLPWMSVLLELRRELNPGRTSLPVVLDSPLNVEKDDGKRDGQYGLIFERLGVEGQLVVSGLGLQGYASLPAGASVVALGNGKRRLLCPEDYAEHAGALFERMRAVQGYLAGEGGGDA